MVGGREVVCMSSEPAVSFEESGSVDVTQPTLVEGLPGYGLVASITVDVLNRQLGLREYGSVVSPAFPQVASFEDGRVREPVRVYGGSNPDVMTLVGDVALPQSAYGALGDVVLSELAPSFSRAVFVAGAPTVDEAERGEVVGMATTPEVERDLREAGVSLAAGSGLVGGVTGALASACHRRGVPAAVLVVGTNPYVPDPLAAKAVIETALEPLVSFDVDTSVLEREAEDIEERLKEVAEQYRQAEASNAPIREESSMPSMYQ